MGAVAIWSMHFIGNRAIMMDNGQKSAQIQYNPGFTAGSFFVPTIVIGVAFYFFSISENVSKLGTLVGGILTGLAVCGMHYMGQGGIANYSPSYQWHYILGSAIIATIATTVALSAFFYFKSIWTNNWWKRVLCASLLALGVSGMHWVATVGTVYRLKHDRISQTTVGLSRQATVIVVICLVSPLSSASHWVCNTDVLSLLAAALRSLHSPLSGSVHVNARRIELKKLYLHALPLIRREGSWSHQRVCCHAAKSQTPTLSE